jgi:hypothetical protein
MTDATVVIKGRNELGLAVKQAEQQLKNLARTGDLVGKVLRGGAIVGAIVAFERLSENAEKAALAIGDKGTAKALHQLNGEIDKLKQKGTNLIGQVLGAVYINFRGTEIQKLTQDISNLRVELDRLNQSNGGSAAGLPGYEAKQRQLNALTAKLANAIALEASFTSRRGFAVSRGNDGNNGVRTRYSSAFDVEPEKAAKVAGYAPSAEMVAYTERLERMGEANRHFIDTVGDADKAIREGFSDGLEIGEQQLEQLATTAGETTKEINIFAEEAARGMQRAFADFFFDPFEDGLKGMLGGFVQTIHRMVAELFAQQALTSFFTWGAGLGGGIGKFAGSLLSGITGKASGGSVYGGTPYLVGEKGPELFVPGASGSIVPNHAMGGGVTIINNVDARGADAERIMSVMPGLLKQTEDRTIARIRDMNGRGRL